MESCGMSLVKYLLFFFNLIFAVSGIGIITAGSLVLADVGEFNHFVEGRILAAPIVLIVAGSIIFIIAFLGCFGAIRESYGLLMSFAVCLLIIFIIELAVGIAAAVFKNDFEDALKSSLKLSMKNYSSNASEKSSWDDVHNKLKCCGVDGPEDWIPIQGVVPGSCCKDLYRNTNCISGNYETGCLTKLKEKIKGQATILIGVGIGIAFVQVLGIVLACLLAANIKRDGGK